MDNNYCVYIHTNKINGKKYVGITRQNPPDKRWKKGTGYTNNYYFTNSIKKYGWDNFNHEIIYDGLSQDDAKKHEIELIAEYNTTNEKFGYNKTKGGDFTAEITDEKIHNLREGHRYEFVPVLQFSLEGELLNSFDSMTEAGRFIGANSSGIRNCANTLRGKYNNKTFYGYIWVFKEDLELFNSLDLQKYLEVNYSIEINKYEYPSGKYIKSYKTVLEAAQDNNVSSDVISLCVREVQFQSSGFTYRKRINNDDSDISIYVKPKTLTPSAIKVVGINIKDNSIVKIYDAIKFSEKDGFGATHIAECCSGKRKTHKGFKWMYYEEYQKEGEKLADF
jgi:hypothetical protein